MNQAEEENWWKQKKSADAKQKYAEVTDTGIFNLHLTKFNWIHKFGDVSIYLIYVFDWMKALFAGFCKWFYASYESAQHGVHRPVYKSHTIKGYLKAEDDKNQQEKNPRKIWAHGPQWLSSEEATDGTEHWPKPMCSINMFHDY